MRLETIRVIVDEMVIGISNTDRRRDAYVHQYGVSSFATMLALRSGQDAELAAIAGMLHLYYFYKTGISAFQGENSSEAVRPILRSTGLFTKEEQRAILRAIFYHNDLLHPHSMFEETIKDAVLLHRHLHHVGKPMTASHAERLKIICSELLLSNDAVLWHPIANVTAANDDAGSRRLRLADIAETYAAKGIRGIAGDPDYRALCSYWPDKNIYSVLKDSWCAAFVYYCCRQAGLFLPIRYPNGICRFAGVAAWLEWAQLPEVQSFHRVDDGGFVPSRGDIVIYEKLLSNKLHDHIGIVLACHKDELIVAEGNMDNKNYSAIVRRDRWNWIAGYIRVDDEYQYSFTGEYEPILD